MKQVVALLRGINVGGHRRIAMAELRDAIAEIGYDDVRTHLQSGNVVVATDQKADDVARAIERQIEKRLGHAVDVIARTGAELRKVVSADPFAAVADDPKKQFVGFLSAKPDADALRELGSEDFAPDEFSARGREIYVWCPDGMRDSRLMTVLSRKRLGAAMTVRNWNTVTRLHEMCQAGG